MAIPDLAVSGLLEIENIEGVGRSGNDVGSGGTFLRDSLAGGLGRGLGGCLGQGALLEESGDSAAGSNIGACGHEFHKFTTGRGVRGKLSHDCGECYRWSPLLTSNDLRT